MADRKAHLTISRRGVAKMGLVLIPSLLVLRYTRPATSRAQQSEPLLSQQRMNQLVSVFSVALTKNAAGQLVLDQSLLAQSGIDLEAISVVAELVDDLNAGKIGIAYIEAGKSLATYGSAAALPLTGEGPILNAGGLWLFINNYWVAKIIDFAWLIDAIVGIIVTLLEAAIQLLLPSLPEIIKQAIQWLLDHIREYVEYLIDLLLTKSPTSIDMRIYRLGPPEEHLYSGERVKRFAVCEKDVGCRAVPQIYIPIVQR